MKIHILIPKVDLQKEFGWFYDQWGEHAVKTYIVKHPEIQSLVDTDISLVGVGELWFTPQEPNQRHSVDLLFRRGKTFFAVEVKKRGSNLQSAWRQLNQEVACVEGDMKVHKEPFDRIVPVLVSVSAELSEPLRRREE